MKEAKLTCFANPNNRNRYYVAPTGDGKSKCFIGRTANGFDFLGYTIHAQRCHRWLKTDSKVLITRKEGINLYYICILRHPGIP